MQVQCEAVPKPITAREEAQWRAMIEAVLRDHFPGVTLSGEAWREETHTDFVLCSAARRHKVALRDTVKREMSERFSVVTGATLGTTTLLTNRGQATVPAWRFSVAGLTQPLVRVAIDPASMTTPPAPSFDSRPTNLGVEVAQLIGVSGNEIRYQLWIGACNTEPRTLLHEEADIIVLGGVVTPPPPNSTCTSQAIAAPVAATTETPVGDRPIVDAITGQAVTRKYPVG